MKIETCGDDKAESTTYQDWEKALESAESGQKLATEQLSEASLVRDEAESALSASIADCHEKLRYDFGKWLPARNAGPAEFRDRLRLLARWAGLGYPPAGPLSSGPNVVAQGDVSQAEKAAANMIGDMASRLGSAMDVAKKARDEASRCLTALLAASDAVGALTLYGDNVAANTLTDLDAEIDAAAADLVRLEDAAGVSAREKDSFSRELGKLNVAGLDADAAMAKTASEKKAAESTLQNAISRECELKSGLQRASERVQVFAQRIEAANVRLESLRSARRRVEYAVFRWKLDQAEAGLSKIFSNDGEIAACVSRVNQIIAGMNSVAAQADRIQPLEISVESRHFRFLESLNESIVYGGKLP